jgi:TolB-like protein/Tfp pilus assembly protein PilF
MTFKPNRITHFWRELKRRRVIHVIAVYASAAFVVIELVNNLTEPLHLPPGLATIVIIILAVGFPLAAILGWIYDLTPDGISRTGPAEELPGEASSSVPNAWKIATYASFVVIAGLVLWNVLGGSEKLHAGDIDSLVILPFENLTGDDQLENMVSGMHSLLIGDVGRISGLRVIGKTSSKVYQDAQMTAKDIAREANVDALVEATVMCLGDTVCMQFRLIRANGEEEQLWVGDYTEDKSQILNMYNRVTKEIANEVMVKLTDREETYLARDRTADREVIDAYIRSYMYWGNLSMEGFDQAEIYLAEAIEKDPEWAPLYGAMAMVWGGRLQSGLVDNEFGRSQLYENLNRANELDPDFTDSHFIVGVISIWVDWNWEKGEYELLQAIAVNPNHGYARIYYAHLLMILQRMDEAMIQAKLALELEPADPLVLTLYATVLKGAGKFQSSLEYVEKALTIEPGHPFVRGQLGRACYNAGQYEKDLRLTQQNISGLLGEENVPDLVVLFETKGRLEAYQEVARLYELYMNGHDYSPISMARHYLRSGAYSRALDMLEKAHTDHNPNLPYFGTGTRFEALHDSARFLAILDTMNLPHPAH